MLARAAKTFFWPARAAKTFVWHSWGIPRIPGEPLERAGGTGGLGNPNRLLKGK